MAKATRGSSFALRYMQKITPGGLRGLAANYDKTFQKIETAALAGLVRGAIGIRRDMDKVQPLIPVDSSNLRHSFFVVTSRGSVKQGEAPKFSDKNKDVAKLEVSQARAIGVSASLAQSHSATIQGPAVVLGFGAYYAVYVHEMIAGPLGGRSGYYWPSKINWSRPGSGPKFLEAAMKRNGDYVLKMVETEVAKVLP